MHSYLNVKMYDHYTIREIPLTERPYEKCELWGAQSLSDAELLSVIIRTGTRGENALKLSERILYDAGKEGLLSIHQFSIKRLMSIRGVGRVKAIQISCISELAKRLSKACAQGSICFMNPESVANCYMEEMRHDTREVMKLLMLNTRSRLIGECDISKGTVNASLITPREIFIEALEKNAVYIVLLHNHPSGDPSPSREDRLITERIKASGELIGIELLDHIIIGNNCFFSFRQEKII